MHVVPAGMHNAYLVAAVLTFLYRFEWQVDLLDNRQRIHVCAKCDQRTRLTALQYGNDAGVSDACLYFQAHAFQFRRNFGGCFEFTVTEFRIFVKMSPPLNDLLLETRHIESDVRR